MNSQVTDPAAKTTVARENLIGYFTRCCLPPRLRTEPLDPALKASMSDAADFLLSHADAPSSDDRLVLDRASDLEPVRRQRLHRATLTNRHAPTIGSFHAWREPQAVKSGSVPERNATR